jgi:hypothetical protein
MGNLNLSELVRVSLEEIQDEQYVNVDLTPEIIVESNDAVAEVEEAHREVQEVNDRATDIEELAGHLENTVVIAQEALGYGGLNVAGAAQFHASVSRVYRAVGLPTDKVPSMESFGDDRVAYTTVSVENAMTTLKAFWDALIKVLKEAWARVAKFFEQLFSATAALEKRASGVYKAAKNVKGKAEGEINVVSPASVVYGGKVTMDAIGKGILSSGHFYNSAIKATISSYASAAETIREATKDEAAALAKFEKITVSTASVSGNQTVSVVDGVFLSKTVGSVPSASIAVPSAAEIAAVAKDVITFVRDVKSTEAELKHLKTAKEEFLENAKNATNGNKEGFANLKKFYSAVESIQRKREKALAGVVRGGIQASKAALATAERALAAYKDDSKPASKTDDVAKKVKDNTDKTADNAKKVKQASDDIAANTDKAKKALDA